LIGPQVLTDQRVHVECSRSGFNHHENLRQVVLHGFKKALGRVLYALILEVFLPPILLENCVDQQ
jgi:hypothetical protein